jgi:hypothetical protein
MPPLGSGAPLIRLVDETPRNRDEDAKQLSDYR